MYFVYLFLHNLIFSGIGCFYAHNFCFQLTFEYGHLNVGLQKAVIKRSVPAPERVLIKEDNLLPAPTKIIIICTLSMIIVVLLISAVACTLIINAKRRKAPVVSKPEISYIDRERNGEYTALVTASHRLNQLSNALALLKVFTLY